jgi:hypothetical protein
LVDFSKEEKEKELVTDAGEIYTQKKKFIKEEYPKSFQF